MVAIGKFIARSTFRSILAGILWGGMTILKARGISVAFRCKERRGGQKNQVIKDLKNFTCSKNFYQAPNFTQNSRFK